MLISHHAERHMTQTDREGGGEVNGMTSKVHSAPFLSFTGFVEVMNGKQQFRECAARYLEKAEVYK